MRTQTKFQHKRTRSNNQLATASQLSPHQAAIEVGCFQTPNTRPQLTREKIRSKFVRCIFFCRASSPVANIWCHCGDCGSENDPHKGISAEKKTCDDVINVKLCCVFSCGWNVGFQCFTGHRFNCFTSHAHGLADNSQEAHKQIHSVHQRQRVILKL